MIKLENTEVLGWEAAIRGMRNPMNSWEKSDSLFKEGELPDPDGFMNTVYKSLSGGLYGKDDEYDPVIVGDNDHDLMMRLAKAGSVDAKYRRMIVVTVDITAPLYWWKEFDTYKVGTVANSCSTMHKIASKEFTLEDFSCEHLIDVMEMLSMPDDLRPNLKVDFSDDKCPYAFYDIAPLGVLQDTINMLNVCREKFLETKDKRYWWQMIQLLPSSYNQRRTVMLNYEVLAGIYPKRKVHKLDEWHDFCDWIKTLPYSEIITLEENKE